MEEIMGFLEDLAAKGLGSMLSGGGSGGSNPLVSAVMQMIANQPGGLSGLVQQFQDKGLGSLMSSWVGTGQNLPISADQLQHALGAQQVQDLATKAGISPAAAGSSLTSLLPMLVDKLTPNGQVSDSSSLLASGLSMLKNLGRTGTEG